MHSQAQAPSVQRPACTVPVVASGGQERSRGRAGRLGRLGRPVLPPAVTVRPLLAGVATGFCPQGTGAGASPAPLQSVLVVCPWGGCHHRPHTAPQGSRGWTPAFSAAPAGPEEQGWAPRPLRGTVPTAVCSQHPSPLAELKGRASLGKRRPPHAPCWAPGMQARARGGPMCRTQEACRTRSRGAGSDISCGLEGLLVWAGEWAWEGHPEQAGGEVTGRVGIQAGQTGHWAGWRGGGGASQGSGMAAGGAAAGPLGMCPLWHASGGRRCSLWPVHPQACQVACHAPLSQPTFRRHLKLNIPHQALYFHKLATPFPGRECHRRSPVLGTWQPSWTLRCHLASPAHFVPGPLRLRVSPVPCGPVTPPSLL